MTHTVVRLALAISGTLLACVAAGFWIAPESDPPWVGALAPTTAAVLVLGLAVAL